MITCSRCKKSNPPDAKYCLRCGNHLSGANISVEPPKKSWTSKIPVLGWIVIGIVALGAGLTFIIGSFWAVATVGGVASIIFFIAGCFLFGVYRKGNFTTNKMFRAITIGFFALMGACVDQTGNYLYNLPIEKIECPAGTTLGRRADVDHPYAGKTVITQDFSCYNASGEREKTINTFAVMGYRFIEYIILAYFLIAVRFIVNQIRENRKTV